MNFDILDQDYEQLTRAFNAIAKIKSRPRRRFHLVRTAAYHRLPKSEMKGIYQDWLAEREMEGGDV